MIHEPPKDGKETLSVSKFLKYFFFREESNFKVNPQTVGDKALSMRESHDSCPKKSSISRPTSPLPSKEKKESSGRGIYQYEKFIKLTHNEVIGHVGVHVQIKSSDSLFDGVRLVDGVVPVFGHGFRSISDLGPK